MSEKQTEMCLPQHRQWRKHNKRNGEHREYGMSIKNHTFPHSLVTVEQSSGSNSVNQRLSLSLRIMKFFGAKEFILEDSLNN